MSVFESARARLRGVVVRTPERSDCWRKENKVVAEGAGAIAVAAALSDRHRFGNVCAVVSGGNLDSALLAKILRGEDI